jgi:hypothetical protein
MSKLRLHTLPAAALAAALATSAPAHAQDLFDWLNGPPPKKKQETYKGEVPEPVQRDTLPDLSPPPNAAGTAPPSATPRVDNTGEPIPRGPDGAPYDGEGNPLPANVPPPAAAPDTEQFDPLEARRDGYRQAPPPPRPPSAPAALPWQNPDRQNPNRATAPPAPQGERWAPGTFEDEQSRPSDGGAGQPPAQGNDDGAGPYYDSRPPGRSGRGSDEGPRMRQGYNQTPSWQQEQRPPDPGRPQGEADETAPRPVPGGAGTDTRAIHDPWRAVPIAELESTLSSIDLPPRSPAIHGLWVRLVTASSGSTDAKLAAIRADALNRTGMTREAAAALAQAGDVASDPVMATLAARTAIGAGQTEQGCEIARSLTSAVAAKMQQNLKGEVILIAGYCAAASDNRPAAGIAGDLAIENGLQDHAGPQALKAIAAGQKPAVARGQKVSLLDYRILQLGGPVDIAYTIPTASPALLAVLARDQRADTATRLAAAEAAAGLNAISLDELAAAYRAGADAGKSVELSDAVADAGQPTRRAALFVAAETERTPLKRARVIRAFLDEARRAGFHWPALQLMAGPANDIQPIPEIGWFAETAVEASLAGGNYAGLRRWADFAATLDNRSDLRHWLALADIADPQAASSTQNLGVIEDLAQRGRFDAALLHRLATCLDALDIQVPMPLWEAASRTEQPSTGHLPDTGVLSQLQDAAKQRDYARTVLLVMRTVGPGGAEGAHMIALGDAIRALKRADLEPEARRLALEALFPAWPRASNS